MAVSIKVNTPVVEGGVLRLSIVSDTPGLSIISRLGVSIRYGDGSFGAGSYGATGSTTASTFDFEALDLRDDDNPESLGRWAFTGEVIVNGVTYPVNLSGDIADNDVAQTTFTPTVPGGRNALLTNIGRRTVMNTVASSVVYAGTGREIVHKIEPDVIATTSVAVTTYQFFTGKAPTLGGLNYLIRSSENSKALDSTYYTSFNLENRYINFASNLGVYGEGKTAFKAVYGSLSMHDAIVQAYGQIVGGDNPAAVSSIEASTGYFQTLARERIGGSDQDIAAKAAMVGYLLQEAVRGGVGVYARSLENFYIDLADGQAITGVDLVGTYGPGTQLDTLP